MSAAPGLADHLLVALSIGLSLFWRWSYPRRVRRIEAGVHGARLGLYRDVIVATWALVGGLVVLWIARARSWGMLGLQIGTPWRLAVGFAIAAAYVLVAVKQRNAILRAGPETLKKVE